MPLSITSTALQAQDRRGYTNIKHQGATPRFEGFVKLLEGSNDSEPTKATQEPSTL
jgi:hypothetical protein